MSNEELLAQVKKDCDEMLAKAVDKEQMSKHALKEYYYIDVARGIMVRDWLEYAVYDEDKQWLVDYIKTKGEDAFGYLLNVAEEVEGFDQQLEDMIDEDYMYEGKMAC